MLPSDIATHTSRDSGGTLVTASSTWIKMFPTCGPLPWTITRPNPFLRMGMSARAVSWAFSSCSHCVPSCPFLMSALPPKATTASFLCCGMNEELRQLRQDVVQVGLADLLQLVGDAQRRLLEMDRPAQVDGRGDQHEIAIDLVDRLLELVHLLLPVAHRRQQRPDPRVLSEGGGDRADGGRARVDDRPRPEALGGDHPGPVAHLTVCQGGAVLDHQDALAADGRRVLDGHR